MEAGKDRDYGRGQAKLPVYKMPHLEGWAVADNQAFVPAVGRHQVLVMDARTWTQTAAIPVAGQPVFVTARPDGRQLWVNFAYPDNDRVQVIDSETHQIIADLLRIAVRRSITEPLANMLFGGETGSKGAAGGAEAPQTTHEE